MPKALISTLGFDEKFCYRAILRHGIREDDKVILITAKLVERTLKAFEMIRNFLISSYGSKVSIEVVEVDVKNIIGSIESVMLRLNQLKGYELIVNLSGGMRALILITLLALLLRRPNNIKVEMELEDLSGVIEVSKSLLNAPLLTLELSDEKKKILKLIREGVREVEPLANKLRRDVSTIRRHVSDLEEIGLLIVEKRKPIRVKPTPLAKLILLS